MKIDYSKRCFCAVQYEKGELKGKWCPDHIHLTVDKDIYYCGECGSHLSINLAIPNK